MNNITSMLECKTWAIVGATDNKDKFGYKIFKFMKNAEMDIYPVNPGMTEVMGRKCYPTLSELPIKPDVVNVVVPPRVGEQIIHDCVKLGIKNVWLQPGADSEQIIQLAQQLGLNVVHHACVMGEIKKKGGV